MIRKLTMAAVLVALVAAPGAPALAAGKCKLVKIAEWPVRIEREHLVIDGTINGQKIGVMLDTGASHTMILRSAALRLGLARQTVANARLFGVGGESDVESALVDEIRIGDASRKGWQMLVGGEHDFGGNVDVVLGEDFFSKADIEFDLGSRAVRLFQPEDCSGVSLAYWAKDGGRFVDLEPIDEATPQIVFTVQVNGHAVRALLDSGASTSVLNKNHAYDVGVTPQTPGAVPAAQAFGVGPKPVDVWYAPFDSVTIGDERIRDAMLAFSDLYKGATYTPIGSYIARSTSTLKPMLIGVDFLRSHRVLVSHRQRRMFFTYVGGAAFNAPARADTARSDARQPPSR